MQSAKTQTSIWRNTAPFVLVAVGLVSLPAGQSGGSGDRPNDLLAAAAAFAIGAIGSLLYTKFEHKPGREAQLRLAAWSFMRLFLVFEFTRYGVAKIVGMQFWPRSYLLDARVVDLAPRYLAWSFFGRSYPYQAASGVLELVGAGLLCFRRTTTMGACLLAVIMSNVVLVNYSFGIAVRLFSTICLGMILYLLSLERRRFWAFFVTGGAAPANQYLNGSEEPRGPRRRIATCVLFIVVAGIAFATILHEANRHRLFVHEPYLGAWNVKRASGVDTFITQATSKWEKVYLEKGDYGFVRTGAGRIRFDTSLDVSTQALTLTLSGGNESVKLVGRFELRGSELHFWGECLGELFIIELSRDFAIAEPPHSQP